MSPVIAYADNLATHPTLPDIFQYAWLEGIMKAKLVFLKNVPDWHDLSKWPEGRIFGDTGEYRWHLRQQNQVHCVMILDNETHLLDCKWEKKIQLELNYEDLENLILRGDWIDPELDRESNQNGGPCFFTNEIPVVHCYPLEFSAADFKKMSKKGLTPRLTTRRYRNHNEGEFFRCVSLVFEEDVQL